MFWNWLKDLFGSKNILPMPVEKKEVVQSELSSLDSKLRARLTELVKRDIGLRETHGKNRSPMIDLINTNVKGAYIGGPYCIAGLVYRGIKALAEEQKMKIPAWMDTASTQSFYDRSPSLYRRPKGEMPKKGDIGIQQQYADENKGHAYMLDADQVSVNQYTLEYNTDGSGGRDGDGFYTRIRTQGGDTSKRYRGAVDVVQALIDYNKKD